MILNCLSFSLNNEFTACAVPIPLTERKILSLDCSLSTFNTLTCSNPIDKISFGDVFDKSPPTLTKVTIPVVLTELIPADVVPSPTNDNTLVDNPTTYEPSNFNPFVDNPDIVIVSFFLNGCGVDDTKSNLLGSLEL